MPTPPPTGPLVTRRTLARHLRDLGVRPGEVLLVHSSLGSLGRVCGGTVGAAAARLFPAADAVAYAGWWLPVHRPREEDIAHPHA